MYAAGALFVRGYARLYHFVVKVTAFAINVVRGWARLYPSSRDGGKLPRDFYGAHFGGCLGGRQSIQS